MNRIGPKVNTDSLILAYDAQVLQNYNTLKGRFGQ